MDNVRVRPRIWIGFLVAFGYIALVVLVQAFSGVPYPEWGDSGSNLFRGVGVSLIVGTVAIIIVTSALGWWRPVIFESARPRHRWPVIAPIAMGLLVVVNLLSVDWGAYDGTFFAASVVLLLVGFTEEVATRGVLLVALRSRLREVWVWLITSVVFGAMHSVNFLLGQSDVATVQQVLFAFLSGTVFYILRRVSGSLILAMVLHGAWDFSSFAVGVGHAADSAAVVNVIYPIVCIFALATVAFVLRNRVSNSEA